MHKPPITPPTRLPVLLLVLLLGLPAIAHSVDPYDEYRDEVERGEFSYDDSQDIPWIENETEVLAPPREDDLVQVAMDELPPRMELLIDTRRLTVGQGDGVIRLWMVVRSEAGVENGSFEGYRCDTHEYKVYAYSNPHRTPRVTKAKRPRWRTIGKRSVGNYRLELLRDYFCEVHATRNADEIRLALRRTFGRDTYFSN